MSESRHELPGSHRAPVAGAEPIGSIDAQQRIELTLVLRRRTELPGAAVRAGTLTPLELSERHGADPADIAAVRAALADIEIVEVDAASRRVRIAGPAGRLAQLFGTELELVRSPDPVSGALVEHRHRQGSLSLPGPLAGVVVAVLGLDDRPQARAHLRVAATATTSYTPLDLARIYSLPAADGTGQTLAIVELGGGFGSSDLDTYFSGLKLATPSVRAVGVDGAANQPGQDPSGADGEVLLDIEVAGAIVPRAELFVYFAPNTDAGFLDAVSTAVQASPTPTALSISWGQSEDDWTAQARTAMDAAFADAAALGVTVTAAAGDDGSSDRVSDGKAHVDFPASSPHVLACGGTSLHANPTSGAVASETVWNDGANGGATGGGVSDAFTLPSWQRGIGVPARPGGGSGRGVPDVAGDADPRTGYQVYVDGQAMVIGGTSAVAPLWAAITCRLAQSLGRRLGWLQPSLYPLKSGLRDIVSGDNGAYRAGPGWDACTGLGVPDGVALLAALTSGNAD